MPGVKVSSVQKERVIARLFDLPVFVIELQIKNVWKFLAF